MSLKKAIRKGDTTTHGGIVLEGLNDFPIMGKEAAYMGHMVYCPKCHGVYPIVEGVQGMNMYGKPVSVEGMKTACGAKLISSQDNLTIDVPDILNLSFSPNSYSSYLIASLDDNYYGAPTEPVKPLPKEPENKITRVTIMIDDNYSEHGRFFGYHAGLMIGESGRKDSMIYDPSGSYDPCWKKNNCDSGSNGFRKND